MSRSIDGSSTWVSALADAATTKIEAALLRLNWFATLPGSEAAAR